MILVGIVILFISAYLGVKTVIIDGKMYPEGFESMVWAITLLTVGLFIISMGIL